MNDVFLHAERVEIRCLKEGGIFFPDEVGHFLVHKSMCRVKSLSTWEAEARPQTNSVLDQFGDLLWGVAHFRKVSIS